MNLIDTVQKLVNAKKAIVAPIEASFERVIEILEFLKAVAVDAEEFFKEHAPATPEPIPAPAHAPAKGKPKKEAAPKEPLKGVDPAVLDQFQTVSTDLIALANRNPGAVKMQRKGKPGMNPYFEVALCRVAAQLASEITDKLENK